MNLLVALVFAILIGVGAHLMVRRDAVKMIAGTLIISNAAVLLLVSGGFGAVTAPFLPLDDLSDAADPLVQALALTAVVINFGTSVLLLRVALAVERTHDTLEVKELAKAERAEGEERL